MLGGRLPYFVGLKLKDFSKQICKRLLLFFLVSCCLAGVYCTPNAFTALGYARPHCVFADGVYHRVILELKVDRTRQKLNRRKGGTQWVFASDAVSIHGVWVCLNSPPEKGQQRLEAWDPRLEVRPNGADPAPSVLNPRPNVQPWTQPENAPPQIESCEVSAALSGLDLSRLHCPPPPCQAPPPLPAVGLRLSRVQAPDFVHASASEDEDPVPSTLSTTTRASRTS